MKTNILKVIIIALLCLFTSCFRQAVKCPNCHTRLFLSEDYKDTLEKEVKILLHQDQYACYHTFIHSYERVKGIGIKVTEVSGETYTMAFSITRTGFTNNRVYYQVVNLKGFAEHTNTGGRGCLKITDPIKEWVEYPKKDSR